MMKFLKLKNKVGLRIDINLQKIDEETPFEHKLRLCKAKLNKEIDLDWQEIVDILGTNEHYDNLRKKAYGYVEYDNYLKNHNIINNRILSISDLHIPFQLPIDTFEDYVGKVDILQLNGDITDCQAISKFPKIYRISPMEELIETRNYIIKLIDMIKPQKVIVNYGNHDIRFQNYFAKNLDTDLLELMPKTSLELIFVDGFKHYNKRERTKTEYKPLIEVIDDIDIVYTDNWFCQIGQTIFCHPLAFSNGMMKTSENAMNYFRNEGYNFSSLIMAHTHRIGEYVVGNTTLYEQGCCCDTKNNNYSDGRLTKTQKEGFIYICQDENGKLLRDKTKLVCLN